MSKIDEAINGLSKLAVKANYQTADKEIVEAVIDLLESKKNSDSDQDTIEKTEREGVVITKNEGIIVCLTWQNGEGQIQEVLAESCGYPDMKAREAQALETIQNLMGAFDNPITRRKVVNDTTSEAIAQGRAYLEQHAPDDEKDSNGL